MSPLPSIPEGLDLITTNDGVIIRKVWLNWTIAPLALFAIVWNCFLFIAYKAMLSAPNLPIFVLLFPVLHVAVGVGLAYFVLASLVNKTDVVIARGRVQVETGPAPWWGNKSVSSEDIADVLVRERSGNKGSRTFNVMYVDRSRKERKLISFLTRGEQAEFIAQSIREGLGLKHES